jgi:hypothetical protein
VKGADVRFFLGQPEREALSGEVFLQAPDDYYSLPYKVRELSRWALANGYERLLKLDDDALLFPNRVIVPSSHCVGWMQPCGDYCAGFAYWLSRRAMEVVANADIPEGMHSEDRWTGAVLAAAGIKPEPMPARSLYWVGRNRPLVLDRQRLRYAYVAGEFTPEEMVQVFNS